MSYHQIENGTITQTWPARTKDIYLPELDIHIGPDEYEQHGIYQETTQDAALSDLERIASYDLQVIEGRPVRVPVVENLPLKDAKRVRIKQVKQEGLSRIQAVLPGVKDFDTLMLIASLWQSIKSTATSPTPPFQQAIDIYNAGEQAITGVNGFTTFQQVADSDPVTGPSWP